MEFDLLRYPTRDSFAVADRTVQVWCINLDQPNDRVERFKQVLSPDERQRAGRYFKVKDTEHFIIARGSLRTLLGHYLQIEPHQLLFSYSTQGKPQVAEALNQGLRFNLSHSANLALLAVTCNREVGIDIEALCTDFDVEQIAKQYFTPSDYAKLCAAPRNRRHELFYACWTLQEAYLKASGLGFSTSRDRLVRFSVANRAPGWLEDDTESGDKIRWWSHKLEAPPGYAAALVTEGREGEIQYWRFPDMKI